MSERKDEMITLSENLVATKIYLIRDKRVMLDMDLAELLWPESRIQQ